LLSNADAHSFFFEVSVNVGDWVEVDCDYSPGVCCEGGTGVVIAKTEGCLLYLSCIQQSLICKIMFVDGFVTVKYIYGPASVASSHDDVIGSSLSGRIEANVGLCRMTTIAMPIKGYPSSKPSILITITFNHQTKTLIAPNLYTSKLQRA
jgi:hypothetical protein